MTAKPPSGYKNQSTDVVGMWSPELSDSIHFVPKGVKLFDSSIDKSKPSCLVIGSLIDPCTLVTREDGEDEPVDGITGSIVGVWYKPGMRALLNLQGVKVWITPDGEKDIGKPSPMKLFKVLAPEVGQRLSILEDSRKLSLGVKTSFDAVARKAPEQGDSQEQIPF